jgi:putative ABC transport system substrate-binding protein
VSVSAAALWLLPGCGLAPSAVVGRLPRVGYLSVGPRESQAEFVDAFLASLRDVDYFEGRTIAIEWRFNDPLGPVDQFQVLAAELVRVPVDLIVAGASTPAAQAAREATSTIPILAVALRDRVATGLVASLARPGGNPTALPTSPAGLATKSAEILRQFVPALARVAVVVDSTNPTMVLAWEENRMGAQQAGVDAERIDIQSPQNLDAAFAAAASMRADAGIVNANPLLLPVSARLAELALHYRLLSTGLKQYTESGLLFNYGADLAAVHRRAGVCRQNSQGGQACRIAGRTTNDI